MEFAEFTRRKKQLEAAKTKSQNWHSPEGDWRKHIEQSNSFFGNEHCLAVVGLNNGFGAAWRFV